MPPPTTIPPTPPHPSNTHHHHHHNSVRIRDSALVAAAQLSHRYIADRFLPDKAIDLVDEAVRRRFYRCMMSRPVGGWVGA